MHLTYFSFILQRRMQPRNHWYPPYVKGCAPVLHTADAALLSHGPAEGERWTSTKNLYVHSLLLRRYVPSSGLSLDLSHTVSCGHCQYPGTPTQSIRGFWFSSSKRFFRPTENKQTNTDKYSIGSCFLKNLETHPL